MTLAVLHGAICPQHPLHGIRRHNIVHRLTQDNWKEKAVVRVNHAGWLYLWIETVFLLDEQLKPGEHFAVRCVSDRSEVKDYNVTFPDLDAALRNINGTDEGALAATSSAPSSAYPPDGWSDVTEEPAEGKDCDTVAQPLDVNALFLQ